MKFSLPPKLKIFLITAGGVSLTLLMLYILFATAGIMVTIAFDQTFDRMFPGTREANKLAINNQPKLKPDFPFPTDLEPKPFKANLPPIVNGTLSQSPKKAMTWRLLNTITTDSRKYALFGADHLTNPYQGDTDINEVLPLLCIQKINSTAPSGLPKERPGGSYPAGLPKELTGGKMLFGGWDSAMAVALVNVRGSDLTSQALADEKCRWQGSQVTHEDGFQMAAFHHALEIASYRVGWDFWAEIPPSEILGELGTRYWVQINDQPANPW